MKIKAEIFEAKIIIKLLTVFIILLNTFISDLLCQTSDSAFLSVQTIYTSVDDALENPSEVYILNLRKQKLKKIPDEVFTFPNLKILNLSKNKIEVIPSKIKNLKSLIELDLSDNDIQVLPEGLGELDSLRKLILNRNNIDSLPPWIGNLKNLELLDLWGTQIINYPTELGKLNKTLKVLDLRVIFMSQTQQERVQKLLPDVEIYFSKGCNCD